MTSPSTTSQTQETTDARAYWALSPGVGACRTEPLERPGSGHIQLRTRHSGISRGTEVRVALGEVPASEWRRMRCPGQAGEFPFPVKYGYCNVAEVIEGPAEWLGRTVFALYPHQDRYWLPASAVLALPEGLPPARAVLAANMETALNALWDAGVAPGDRVIVIGAGTLGLLIARLADRIPGTDVHIHDINPDRDGVIAALGIRQAGLADLPEDADIAFDASGVQAGLAAALERVGPEGTVVEVGWLGAPVMLPLDGAFHSRRLTIRSSQVGQLPAARRPRWDHRRRLAKALELLSADAALDALITHTIAFDELPSTMARLCAGWREPLTICVDYPTTI